MTTIRLFLDVECYVDYFLVMLMSESGKVRYFEQFAGQDLDKRGLAALLKNPNVEIVTFNGRNYDIPMVTYALFGADCRELKEASDAIITQDLKPWDFERQHRVKIPQLNHIDLMEVAPGDGSLKAYMGRMHCPKLQDLPIEPGASISEEERPVLRRYCRNDLVGTHWLYRKLSKQIDLRRGMSEKYGVDLRSRSDAQVAEAVLRAEVSRRKGFDIPKPNVKYRPFYYEPPAYVHFTTPALKHALQVIQSSLMSVKPSGHVEVPKDIEDLVISVGASEYTVGIGGLHSKEKETAHIADEHTLLIDRDVTSYYPSMMLNMGLTPAAFGEDFLVVFREILEERVAAKRSGDSVVADMLKIVLNGTFGKTSNRWSYLYNPEMMIKTTLTGQLSLLMLIEMLEEKEIPVVSANTDGVVVKCPVEKKETMDRMVAMWETITKLGTEETRYKALYSRDVNNYIAIKEDGTSKAKGVFAKAGLQKNPQTEVCVDAVVAYLVDGVPVSRTIRECLDFTKFLTIRAVRGGAVKDGVLLGKVARWYYAAGQEGDIRYKTSGNTVPRTEGAKPCMDLPNEFPDDVDYSWYEMECRSLLMDLGVIPRPYVPKMPRRNSKAWKAEVEAGRIIVAGKDKWKWRDDLQFDPE